MLESTKESLRQLIPLTKNEIPEECLSLLDKVTFTTENTGAPYFPCPLKETETIGALKAIEAVVAAGVANERYGKEERQLIVDMERASCYLFSTYLCTVKGMGKGSPDVKAILKGERSGH